MPDPSRPPVQHEWWNGRVAICAMIALAALPLLWPALPPLTDLPGHIGRYHVMLALHDTPALQRFYDFHWKLIGNLGVDLSVFALAPLVGLEPATKLIVILIPVLTVAGMLWSAREVHGRVPPTAPFALPLAYAWPFQLGFVNFALSQAFAFVGLGLWLRLGRLERLRLRAAIAVPLGWLLWIAHSFGWAMFGLLAFGAEIARAREKGASWLSAGRGAVIACLPLATPIVAMILGRSTTARGSNTGDWFHVSAKLQWLLSILRDRWQPLDLCSLGILVIAAYYGARDKRLGLAPALAIPALLCAIAFVLLPRMALGGAYVDTRMAPAALALALLAIRPSIEPRHARTIALIALGFALVRTGANTVSFVLRDGEQQGELAAIDAIPRGATVLNLTPQTCVGRWSTPRFDHLGGLALARRDAFSNDQWAIDAQQLLDIRYRAAAPFLADPSQLVTTGDCPALGIPFARAVARFDRRAFRYVWTIGFPPGAARAPDLALVWSNGGSALYRVIPRPR